MQRFTVRTSLTLVSTSVLLLLGTLMLSDPVPAFGWAGNPGGFSSGWGLGTSDWPINTSTCTNPESGGRKLHYQLGDNGLIRSGYAWGKATPTSWTTHNTGTTNDLYAFWFVDRYNVWAAGDGDFVLHSSTYSTSWTKKGALPPSTWRAIIFNPGGNVGIVAGNGIVYRTTDRGETWSACLTSPSVQWNSLTVSTDGNSVFLVGNAGKKMKSTNWGATWTTVPPFTFSNLLSIFTGSGFSGSSVWALAKGSGEIWRSTDGGDTYELAVHVEDTVFRDIEFANESVGWAVGDGGTIYYTEDGGDTWVPADSGTTSDLVSVSVNDAAFVTAADGSLAYSDYSNSPVSTPSSSGWSLALSGIAGIALVSLILRSQRRVLR